MASATLSHEGLAVVPLWINGSAHQPLDPSRIFPVVNAATSSTAHHFQGADPTTASLAASAALSSFPSWSRTGEFSSPERRRAVLLRAADLLAERAPAIADMQVRETSCMPVYANFMAQLGPRIVREIAGSMTAALTGSLPPTDLDRKGGLALVLKEAVGPILLISPWNSPPVLCARGIASALAAGCTVVLKASELAPRLHGMIVEAFEDAGVPPGVVNMVAAARGDAEAVTEALVAHEAIRKVEFIGSAAVGREVGRLAARHLKPVLMELGGKSPAVVLRDADLPQAAAMCAMGAFAHHGQICMSTERIIVEREVADEFSRLLSGAVTKLFSSPGQQQQGQQGQQGQWSAATAAFAKKAHDMVQEALDAGASCLVGDNSYTGGPELTGLRPTIVTDVPRGCRLRDAESFGPSASLYVVEDAEAAVALANESATGLNASVWTADVLKGVGLARRMQAGQVHVNGLTTGDEPQLSVTGTRGSGWGSNNGRWGIEEFLVNKTITVQGAAGPGLLGH